MILPYGPRRAWIQSFAFVAGVLLGLTAPLLRFFGLHGVAVAIGGLGLAVILVGQLRPRVLMLPYRAWNKIARLLAGLTRRVLLFLIFHLIFRSVGWVGRDQLQIRPPAPDEKTMWSPYRLDTPIPHVETSTAGWVRRFIKWGARPGAPMWTLCLLPFLVILSAMERDDQAASSLSADIYTLY